jgi:hypothetical protein
LGYFNFELVSIQRWVKSAAGLDSIRLSTAPPKVARPVILWEAPQRGRGSNTSRYAYVNRMRQYGKLYASNLNQLLDYQGRLEFDLEDRENVLDLYDDAGTVIGKLKNVSIKFENSDDMDVPFSIEYEVGYRRTKPADPPPASSVITRTVITGLE